METVGTWWMWTGFAAIVAAMLVIDLFVVGGGKQRRVSFKEAAAWSAISELAEVVEAPAPQRSVVLPRAVAWSW